VLYESLSLHQGSLFPSLDVLSHLPSLTLSGVL
jgi:hypothetical protein